METMAHLVRCVLLTKWGLSIAIAKSPTSRKLRFGDVWSSFSFYMIQQNTQYLSGEPNLVYCKDLKVFRKPV